MNHHFHYIVHQNYIVDIDDFGWKIDQLAADDWLAVKLAVQFLTSPVLGRRGFAKYPYCTTVQPENM